LRSRGSSLRAARPSRNRAIELIAGRRFEDVRGLCAMVFPKPKLRVDRLEFSTLEGFFNHVSSRIVPGYTWGRNLDAFNDILRSGSATPEGGFVLCRNNHDISERCPGHEETGSCRNGWSDVIQIMLLRSKPNGLLRRAKARRICGIRLARRDHPAPLSWRRGTRGWHRTDAAMTLSRIGRG